MPMSKIASLLRRSPAPALDPVEALGPMELSPGLDAEGAQVRLDASANVLVTGEPGCGATVTCLHMANQGVERGWEVIRLSARGLGKARTFQELVMGPGEYPDGSGKIMDVIQDPQRMAQLLSTLGPGSAQSPRMVLIDGEEALEAMADTSFSPWIEQMRALMSDPHTCVILRAWQLGQKPWRGFYAGFGSHLVMDSAAEPGSGRLIVEGRAEQVRLHTPAPTWLRSR